MKMCKEVYCVKVCGPPEELLDQLVIQVRGGFETLHNSWLHLNRRRAERPVGSARPSLWPPQDPRVCAPFFNFSLFVSSALLPAQESC